MLKLKAGELVRHLARDGDRHKKERSVRVKGQTQILLLSLYNMKEVKFLRVYQG